MHPFVCRVQQVDGNAEAIAVIRREPHGGLGQVHAALVAALVRATATPL